MSPTSIGQVAAMLRLSVLAIGDYYYHSHNKMVKGKMKTGHGYGTSIGGCNRLYPVANGA